MILERIVEKKRLQLSQEMQQMTVESWKQRLKRPGMHSVRDFASALAGKGQISIIAEIKKASPSKGIIRENFNPEEIARDYCASGVQAISVLTEKNFFLGDDSYLVKVRQNTVLPVLRKDFIIDVRQIYQSRCLGADAILLIASILDDEQLKKFIIIAGILGLQCLVEVHDERELERVLEAGARIIGINNRNLKTFEVSLDNTERLINRIPSDRIVVSESGINTAEDIKRLGALGVDAVLIGEAFMRAGSIPDKIKEFRAG